jgi:hypothetical protein
MSTKFVLTQKMRQASSERYTSFENTTRQQPILIAYNAIKVPFYTFAFLHIFYIFFTYLFTYFLRSMTSFLNKKIKMHLSCITQQRCEMTGFEPGSHKPEECCNASAPHLIPTLSCLNAYLKSVTVEKRL